MTLTRKFHHASVSDVHYFHPKTPTGHIVRNMLKAFPDNDTTGLLDAIFIVGDLFDQITHLADPNARMVKVWAVNFLKMCARRDIKVRVLEGTPKHDRTQNSLLMDMAQLAEIPVDIRYVTKLEIEYMEDFGINILYIPDEWSSGSWASSTIETQREVKALLAQKGLEKVDFAFIHGAMNYHLRVVKEHLVHDPVFYESIVQYQIWMGHIHTPEHRGRTIMNGSFDRLAHGEEHPKGHWRTHTKPNGEYHPVFIENKGAMIYKTIRLKDLEVDVCMANIKVALKGIPDGSHIRIHADKGHPVIAGMETLKRTYPTYHFTTKVEDTEGERGHEDGFEDEDPEVGIEITPQNVVGLVEAKLISLGIGLELRGTSLAQLSEDVYESHH
jgi:hypothetical protein